MEHPSQRTYVKQLRRSRRNRLIAGVCGGFGEYFGVDPVLVRIAFVLSGIVQGFGVLAYLACVLLIPKEGKAADFIPEAPRDGAAASAPERHPLIERGERWLTGSNRRFIAWVAIAVGAALLWNLVTVRCGPGRVSSWNLLSYGFQWSFFWPVMLAAFGIFLIIRRPRE